MQPAAIHLQVHPYGGSIYQDNINPNWSGHMADW
jgi:hypothetical protein